ncbi:MAG: type II toxin-antitoxin system VapC family toxin [Anaerolineae bacterium]|nr:type II toxin-antitoxin system VapC family toxin [Anaerolineae bacterium]
MKILDSDHCVAILRSQLDLTEHMGAGEELAITAVAVGELIHGAAKSRHAVENLARVDTLLAAVTVLPFDEWSARRFGLLKAQLKQAGQAIGDIDLLIASIALDREGTLVTHNTRHFSRLVGAAGLILEDWLE